MPFLRNAWYAAGWRHELNDKPIARTLLDEPVVIYKGADGAPIVLADRCAHRFAPLSLGKVEGDAIQCPYHGLVYGRDGVCVRNPHGKGAITSAMAVRSYPVVTQNEIVWVWMGDKEASKDVRPPVYDFHDDSGFTTIFGYLHVDAHYELVTDNLLDLSHAEYLHPFIAPPGSYAHVQYKAEQDGERVTAYHSMPGSPITPLFRMLMDKGVETIDGRAHMHWEAPANMMLDTGAIPVDQPGAASASTPMTHLLTPESENSTHYFWSFARDRMRNDTTISEMMQQGIGDAFTNEDEPMVRAVHQRMGAKPLFDLSPALLPMDEAAVRARRILAKRIAAEQAGA